MLAFANSPGMQMLPQPCIDDRSQPKTRLEGRVGGREGDSNAGRNECA
jgi:hypothetical protein